MVEISTLVVIDTLADLFVAVVVVERVVKGFAVDEASGGRRWGQDIDTLNMYFMAKSFEFLTLWFLCSAYSALIYIWETEKTKHERVAKEVKLCPLVFPHEGDHNSR